MEALEGEKNLSRGEHNTRDVKKESDIRHRLEASCAKCRQASGVYVIRGSNDKRYRSIG